MTQPPRVLIVDDEALLRWALAEHLRSSGFQIETASTAHEALDAFDQAQASGDRLDAVLLDYRLPDADGTLPLLAQLREQQPSLIVLMMSAYGKPEIVAQAESLGAALFLCKPFEYDEVVAHLHRLLAT